MVVNSPKDIVSKGLLNVPDLRQDIVATMLQIIGSSWVGGDGRNAALAYALAVFMLQQAVDSMAQDKALCTQEAKDKEDNEQKESLIILSIGVALIFLPIVGTEAAAALGLNNTARVIAIADELGKAAFATYETVRDPESAIVNILGILFSVGKLAKAERDVNAIRGVAQYLIGMASSEILCLGRFFADRDSELQTLQSKGELRS